MKTSKAQLSASLSKAGYRFSEFSLQTEGKYTVADAMWNYKDAIVHIPHVHTLVRNFPLFVAKDMAGSLFLQRALGFTFPLIVLDLETKANAQTSFTSFGPFFLIIENECIALSPSTTRVLTTYAIATPWFLSFFAPVIRAILRKNYASLTQTDIPMRERRGILRDWGYQFASDGIKNSYQHVLNIARSNLQLAENAKTPPAFHCNVNKLTPDGEAALLGRDDHWGLKVIRKGNQLSIFPRLCPHEGASLDQRDCSQNHMECPWHGRKIDSLVNFDLSQKKKQELHSDHHHFTLKEGWLDIQCRNALAS